MSGRKQFAESEALDAAMVVFRQKGYAATSMSDLESATGLNKSSIYNAFHSKEQLFALCLERMRTVYTAAALDTLDHPDFGTALGQLLDLLGGFEQPDFPGGCMATLAALELGGGDEDELSRIIALGLEDMLERLEARCRRAVEDGQLEKDTDCAELAAMILAVIRGVVVLNKGTGDPAAGRRAFDRLLSTIS